MRNPLKKLFKRRGYPDSCHARDGNSSPPSAVSPSYAPWSPPSTVTPSYAPLPPSSALTLPPTAYPYDAPQQNSEQVWEINTGHNENFRGKQTAGNLRIANSTVASGSAINLPQSGRFVINTGGNTNHGDVQESSNVDFANVY